MANYEKAPQQEGERGIWILVNGRKRRFSDHLVSPLGFSMLIPHLQREVKRLHPNAIVTDDFAILIPKDPQYGIQSTPAE